MVWRNLLGTSYKVPFCKVNNALRVHLNGNLIPFDSTEIDSELEQKYNPGSMSGDPVHIPGATPPSHQRCTVTDSSLSNGSRRVVKSHHKFMLASYMMQIAKFLALLHHNASFYNFCFIIKFSHCLIFS